MNLNSQFLTKLDEIIQKYWRDVLCSKLDGLILYEFTIVIPEELTKLLFAEFELNSDIQIGVHSKYATARTKCFYKNTEIEPKCYYIQPENCIQPTILDILRECIKQDTHTPNIKHLEISK